jgi:hypothetical protein
MSELGGIIRNGMERGWPTDEIKNSLLNAGYSAQEVDYELSLLLKNSPVPQQAPLVKPLVAPLPAAAPPVPAPATLEKKFNPQDLSNYQTPPVEKNASNWMVIAIIVLLVLCVLAGAGLFLFT